MSKQMKAIKKITEKNSPQKEYNEALHSIREKLSENSGLPRSFWDYLSIKTGVEWRKQKNNY